MVTRPSARASGAPAQVWIPCPKAMCCRAFGRSMSNLEGSSNTRGSLLHAPGMSISEAPAGMSTPPSCVGDTRHPELRAEWALEPEGLLNEVGDLLTVCPYHLLEVGSLAQHPQCEGEEAHGGLLAAGEEVGGDQSGVFGLGRRTVRERGGGQAGEDVVARGTAAILDVVVEALVEELERLVADVLVCGGELLSEQRVV